MAKQQSSNMMVTAGSNSRQSLVRVNEALEKKIGLNTAIILQQILDWKGERIDGGWVANTHRDWQERLSFLPLRTIQRALSSLQKQDLLEVKKTQICNLYRLDPVAHKILQKNGVAARKLLNSSSVDQDQKIFLERKFLARLNQTEPGGVVSPGLITKIRHMNQTRYRFTAPRTQTIQ